MDGRRLHQHLCALHSSGVTVLVPSRPKIYHIVHVDRLASIVADGHLWSDAEARKREVGGTNIGLSDIKERRLKELTLSSHRNLYVGDCVPFYFCPRSPMLYKHFMANDPNLPYRGGQESIVHLEADLRRTVNWADATHRRWAFTSSNAGSYYFEDYSDLNQLNVLDWTAIEATDWRECREAKQAEFLVEGSCAWPLITRIGVNSQMIARRVLGATQASRHRPSVVIKPDWYYGER